MAMDYAGGQASRLLRLLAELLPLDAVGVEAAMTHVARVIADALGTDYVAVLLHDPDSDLRIALGLSDTPLGQRVRELGVGRTPLAECGWVAKVFATGISCSTDRAENALGVAPSFMRAPGIEAAMAASLEAAGERCGVLLAGSTVPATFSEDDRTFMAATAHRVSLVGYRAAYVERVATQVDEESLVLGAAYSLEVLTQRQREVTTLVAAGLTNLQIARRLVITPGTTANHIEHIRRPLGVQSRVQVATWATRLGLAPDGPLRPEEARDQREG